MQRCRLLFDADDKSSSYYHSLSNHNALPYYHPLPHNGACPYYGTSHLQELLLSCWSSREAQAWEDQMHNENRLLCTPLLLDVDDNSCSYYYACPHHNTLSYYNALPYYYPMPDNNTTHVRISRCLPEANGVEAWRRKDRVQWNEGKSLQFRWLLHDANDNSCSYYHPCQDDHSLPDYYTMPNNNPSPNNQSVYMQNFLLPSAFCVGGGPWLSYVHWSEWVLH
jgi:hypothetical protein